MKKIYFLLIAIIFTSCENNQEIIINADNLLIGTWVEPFYEEETTTFKRSNDLPSNASGITFKQDGSFIERSSGWCGTPPLSYTDYIGSFEIDETLVKIITDSYPNNYQWRIISVTATTLVVKRELSAQEIEHRNLMALFDEIQSLVYAISCNDIANWTFTTYGAKACGGPQGYIAYSKNMDTVSFLNKVDAYTAAEKDFNIKWNIISDCSLIAQPIALECNNGYPNLKY
ncbi:MULTISPECIES: hypothetical protein [unclassified Polaribacter]|uniref:hypothetical protein n=1 Tax=unclassified Polaribacter TaxID=196858 RepID=UPI0011BEBD17|nr:MULTISPECIES: hypothetical protein [unclassified Polaribacter]TXD53475.1 hypothetical protein ES043_03550 [Polaribacter sp. IC063]TXD57714.1 hypothetical protein ES044_14275 [Polaribacter sp. IC066]